MKQFDREGAVQAVKNVIADYHGDKCPAEGGAWTDLAESIVSEIHLDFVNPLIDAWKSRLGSEIQDLELQRSLLSVHLRLYISAFGTPSLEEMVKNARKGRDHATID